MSAAETQPITQDARPALMAVRSSAWLGRIVCGDNVEVLSGFPDACIDLVVTSPPYDDLRTYGGHLWNFESVARELTRVLKPGGVIVWVVGDMVADGSETGTSMEQALQLRRMGLLLHDTMIYQKNNFANPSSGRYHQTWEYMFVLSKGQPKTFNPIKDRKNEYVGQRAHGKNRTANGWRENTIGETKEEYGMRHNVWLYTTGGGHMTDDAIAHEHPAVFPESLAKDHITSWSNPDDIVLDPFAGSGTTCKAAKELNRQWCGIEINPEYCKIAEARLSQDVLQLETCAMRPNAEVSHDAPPQ